MPIEEAGDSEVDDECLEGEGVERVQMPRGDENVKRIRDPVLPTPEEVDRHFVMGHMPYRDWCPICVKAQGRETAHRKDDGGIAECQNIRLIIVSRG